MSCVRCNDLRWLPNSRGSWSGALRIHTHPSPHSNTCTVVPRFSFRAALSPIDPSPRQKKCRYRCTRSLCCAWREACRRVCWRDTPDTCALLQTSRSSRSVPVGPSRSVGCTLCPQSLTTAMTLTEPGTGRMLRIVCGCYTVADTFLVAVR